MFTTCVQVGLTGDIDDAKYPGCSAVYQTPGTDPKQRWWHILDNAFILPEFIAQVSLSQPTGELAAAKRKASCQPLCLGLIHGASCCPITIHVGALIVCITRVFYPQRQMHGKPG